MRTNQEFLTRNLSFSLNTEKGATLVIALIILLVMSMIGISNMQSSTLQERMAANTKQKTIARVAAESALNKAEAWLTTNMRSPDHLSRFNGSNGLYSSVRNRFHEAVPITQGTEAIADVTDASNWTSRGHSDGTTTNLIDSELVDQQPKYVIEFIGRDAGTGYRDVLSQDYENKKGGASGADINPFMFRIVAIGWGKDPNIYSVLESIYRTGYGPGNFVY